MIIRVDLDGMDIGGVSSSHLELDARDAAKLSVMLRDALSEELDEQVVRLDAIQKASEELAAAMQRREDY